MWLVEIFHFHKVFLIIVNLNYRLTCLKKVQFNRLALIKHFHKREFKTSLYPLQEGY